MIVANTDLSETTIYQITREGHGRVLISIQGDIVAWNGGQNRETAVTTLGLDGSIELFVEDEFL